MNDARSIDNGLALQYCIRIFCTQEHETAAKRSVYTTVELVQTTVCSEEPVMELSKKTSKLKRKTTTKQNNIRCKN